MIATKALTIEDFMLFQERMHDFALFEFMDGAIIPVQGTAPVERSLVDYVLSPTFDENEIHIKFPMATKQHDRIVSNLHFHLRLGLHKENYFIYAQATDVFVPTLQKSFKPDIVLVHKAAEQREHHSILNPIVVFEILSKSTQAKDRSEKLDGYQSMESLQTCILVSQDRCKVMVYEKESQDNWHLQIQTQLEDTLLLKSINFSMRLSEIYEDIEW